MENLHLKNLKHSNLEVIKHSSWFNQFTEEQQYYIESGLENEIDITTFAKKEINPDDMFDILTKLEMEKYEEQLTIPYHMYKTHDQLMKKIVLNSAFGVLDLN